MLFIDIYVFLLHVLVYHQTQTLLLALVISLLFSSKNVWVLRDELMNVRPLEILKAQDTGISKKQKQTNKRTPYFLVYILLF